MVDDCAAQKDNKEETSQKIFHFSSRGDLIREVKGGGEKHRGYKQPRQMLVVKVEGSSDLTVAPTKGKYEDHVAGATDRADPRQRSHGSELEGCVASVRTPIKFLQ